MDWTGDAVPQEEAAAELRQAAKACRQMYIALVNEGFTKQEALQIIGIAMMTARGDTGE